MCDTGGSSSSLLGLIYALRLSSLALLCMFD
jgi:hypothetical protein